MQDASIQCSAARHRPTPGTSQRGGPSGRSLSRAGSRPARPGVALSQAKARWQLIERLIGLALGVGGATTKLLLPLKTGVDRAFVSTYIQVAGPITRLIQLGIVLLTLSGIGWLVLGYPMTPRLVAKLVLVAAIWGRGPIIERGVEPRFRGLTAGPEAAPPPAFIQVRRRYLARDITATLLLYVIIVYWVVLIRLPG